MVILRVRTADNRVIPSVNGDGHARVGFANECFANAVGDVSDLVGAAAIATGAVLYIVGWPGDKSTNVSLLPAVARNGAAMILRGSF
jgi:hypothetical protein